MSSRELRLGRRVSVSAKMDHAMADIEHPPPRIESLHVRNYRALRNVTLEPLPPLTVLLGPNGSGKSTVFDVMAFLSQCFTEGLTRAWDARSRFSELRSRGSEGPILFELKYRERPGTPIITYHLAINEERGKPIVEREWLQWRRGSHGKPFRFIDFERGIGEATSGEVPEASDDRAPERLASPDVLAVNTLGQFERHPRVTALRRFITDWYLSYLTVESARGAPEAGPQDRLSASGDNLANVLQHLQEREPERLQLIFERLSQRVPLLERVITEPLPDHRLLMRFKDRPFDDAILARYASDGTLKLLAYLVILSDPDPPQFIGIEEPENYLNPRLLRTVAEECVVASARAQLMVTTHSPEFVNALEPQAVWVLARDESGFTQAQQAIDIPGVLELYREGEELGRLWMQNAFEQMPLFERG
jgi:predicted ATPase